MNRRSYLTVLGTTVAGLTAGCLGDSGAPADSATAPQSDTTTQTEGAAGPTSTTGTSGPTPPPVDVETPAPGECDAPERPSPSTGEGLPDPREYPDPPGGFDVETLGPYLEAYEGAYRYNVRLADLAEDDACVEYFETEVTKSTLWETDDGVVAEVLTTGSFTGETCPTTDTASGTDTDTATPLPHGDYFTQAAHFLVTERFLVREGRVVECWE